MEANPWLLTSLVLNRAYTYWLMHGEMLREGIQEAASNLPTVFVDVLQKRLLVFDRARVF